MLRLPLTPSWKDYLLLMFVFLIDLEKISSFSNIKSESPSLSVIQIDQSLFYNYLVTKSPI